MKPVVVTCLLVIGVWRSLRAVRWCLMVGCVICVPRCSSFVGCCWLITVCGLLFPGYVCNVLFGACCVSCVVLVVYCWLFGACGLILLRLWSSVARRLLFVVPCSLLLVCRGL